MIVMVRVLLVLAVPLMLLGLPAVGPDAVNAAAENRHRHHRHLSAAWSTLFDVPHDAKQQVHHNAKAPHHRRHPPADADAHDPAVCPSCGQRRALAEQSVPSPELTALRIEFVKQQILKKLRLKEPPVVTKPVSALPKPLAVSSTLSSAEILRQKSSEESSEDNFYGRTDQVILFPAEGAENGHCPSTAPSEAACFPFKLPGDLLAEDVTRADLWLYRRDPEPQNELLDEPEAAEGRSKNATVNVSEITNWDLDASFQRTSHAASQDVTSGEGWVKVDFARTVRYWLESNERTKMVQASCAGCSSSNQTVISSDATHRPFLVIYTNPANKVRRPKRNVHCVPGMAECCRDDLYVSFKDIGWDEWILQPLGYHAYFCRGSCTSAASLTVTGNHHNTITRRLMQIGKKVDLVPCCTPTKYSSVQLLYLNNNQTLVQKTLPNMVVEACGCN